MTTALCVGAASVGRAVTLPSQPSYRRPGTRTTSSGNVTETAGVRSRKYRPTQQPFVPLINHVLIVNSGIEADDHARCSLGNGRPAATEPEPIMIPPNQWSNVRIV